MITRTIGYAYGRLTGMNPNALLKEYRELHDSLHTTARLSGVTVTENPFQRNEHSDELRYLLTKYGSDKATKHDYHLIYGDLIDRKKPLSLLEIGIGTNNTSVPSNMGKGGKPGASLRAFRDWASHATIYGADVDTDILFEEERIKTFFVDQTKPQTFNNIPSQKFDVVIDDGLHTPSANFNTIEYARTVISPGGVIIIEDIADTYIDIWKSMIPVLNGELIQMKSATVCIIHA